MLRMLPKCSPTSSSGSPGPWKKSSSSIRVIKTGTAQSGFTDMNTTENHDSDHDEGSSSPHTASPRVNKVAARPAPSSSEQRELPPRRMKLSPHIRRISGQEWSKVRRINGNGTARSRRISGTLSSPTSSSRKYLADDGDEGSNSHQHSHLIAFESNELDNDVKMTLPTDRSDTTGSQQSHATEGDGWSIGVRKFKVNNGNQEDMSVFNPSECNVAHVPFASHARDSLLKREFKSIKQSLANSFKKYRSKKCNTMTEQTHAISDHYMNSWLKKNKKFASNNSRITKNEIMIFHSFFLKRAQAFFLESGLPVLNFEVLTEEFVNLKIFTGRIEANNFLLKIYLDEKGMISLNDFNSCLQSSSADIQVSQFKAFIKGLKKSDEEKRKIEEARAKAREQQRQLQMASVLNSPDGSSPNRRRSTFGSYRDS